MKHDESTDVRRLSFVGVKTVLQPASNGTVKCLVISPIQRSNLGIKQWGRVDYLTKYCGYRVISNAGMAKSLVIVTRITINLNLLVKQRKKRKLLN